MAAYHQEITLKVTCGLTACTLGSALGPTLCKEYWATWCSCLNIAHIIPGVAWKTDPFQVFSTFNLLINGIHLCLVS